MPTAATSPPTTLNVLVDDLIHTANVGTGHWMRLELAAVGYVVVRSYSRGMWTLDA
jgi:hypothetical protein